MNAFRWCGVEAHLFNVYVYVVVKPGGCPRELVGVKCPTPSESLQPQSLRCSSLVVCDDDATPLDTCRQHQPHQLQQPTRSKGHRAPPRARLIYSKTVLILMRPEERHSLHIDCVLIGTGTITSYAVTKSKLISILMERVIL